MAQAQVSSDIRSQQKIKRGRAIDTLLVTLVLLVLGVGSYGAYDLVMAPQSLTQHDTENEATRKRQGTPSIFGGIFGLQGIELLPGQNQVNVLVMGTDEKREGGRADTIILMMIRKDTKRVAAVSIPRDLMVRIEGHGTQKINAIYALHRKDEMGEIMTGQTVSRILNQPVDFYVKTDVSKFPKLFDALGGLDLYVDRDMKYDDSWGDLHIDLKEGFQHLNGKQIEGFVRHRHDKHGRYSSDQERNQRQQYVLKELVKQKANLTSATHLPQAIGALRSMVKTDMSVAQLAALALLVKDCDMTNIISRMVPTHSYMNGAWYAVLEPERTRELMAQVDAMLAGGPIMPDDSPERNENIGQGSLNAENATKENDQATQN